MKLRRRLERVNNTRAVRIRKSGRRSFYPETFSGLHGSNLNASMQSRRFFVALSAQRVVHHFLKSGQIFQIFRCSL